MNILDHIKNCHCCACALATPDMVPDNGPWEGREKWHKKRVPGYRCHASRPSQAGLPPTDGASFCPYFTDTDGNQPLRHLVSDAVKAEGRDK